MYPTTAMPSCFVGCDVGKTQIVFFDSRSGRSGTIANRPEDLTAFAATLDPDCFVICEATGGYESSLLAALYSVGRAAHRADARKVKAFIRSFGTLAKRSMPARWPDTVRSVRPCSRAGSPPKISATGCRPSSSPGAISSHSGPPAETGSKRPEPTRCATISPS
jgi:hypothetical protein